MIEPGGQIRCIRWCTKLRGLPALPNQLVAASAAVECDRILLIVVARGIAKAMRDLRVREQCRGPGLCYRMLGSKKPCVSPEVSEIRSIEVDDSQFAHCRHFAD